MKIFVIDFKNKSFVYQGFLEANNSGQVLNWFAENCPAKSKLIKITEASKKPEEILHMNEILENLGKVGATKD
jgi:hypothetical protein